MDLGNFGEESYFLQLYLVKQIRILNSYATAKLPLDKTVSSLGETVKKSVIQLMVIW